ncbi:hypothetical protein FACS1894181_17430 [Bacteroidia bacterium]|nr:hypothetical protein FACS1894181_17430 [Bacteroidia bacterium]
MGNNALVLLGCAGQEPGHIHQGYEGNIEGVAETHKTGRLARGIDAEHACQVLGLVGNNTDTLPMMVKSVNAGEQTEAPAQGPKMAKICGTTPDARILRWNIPA